MSTRVVVQYVCDGCDREFEDNVLFKYEIAIPSFAGGSKSGVVVKSSDLCDSCAEVWDETLTDMGFKESKKVKKASKKAPEKKGTATDAFLGCGKCEFVGKTPGGLGVHRKRMGH